MADIKKLPVKETGLTPDIIRNRLFTDHAIAHDFHLATTSFAQHNMLKELYESLEDSKDAICEYLLGMQAPKRFGKMVIGETPMFSTSALSRLLDEGVAFSMQLCEYGESKNYEELVNLASNLQGTYVKGKYLNTLS